MPPRQPAKTGRTQKPGSWRSRPSPICIRGAPAGAPALLLTTIGRKSGDKFIFPLFYGTDGGSYFVVASKGGAPEHPGWYRNILANADVEVQVGTKKLKARARTAEGEERARLWEKALKFWPPYADYQLKTERQIPVIVLDPIH